MTFTCPHSAPRNALATIAAAFALCCCPASSEEMPGATGDLVEDGPWELETNDYVIKVLKMVDGLQRPWSMAFLPNGDILLTERVGRLRLLRAGATALDPQPISGIPPVLVRDLDGLLDIALHPQFKQNRLVYFSYSKEAPDGGGQTALGRGRYDGAHALTQVEELFVGGPATQRQQVQSVTARIAFGPDGMIYLTSGNPARDRLQAQDPSSLRGKILRLRDDGTAPPDNPFVGKALYGAQYAPQIYSMGHRNAMGLAFHPQTGALWEVESGPQGGDELNIILPGRNYGWPFTSLGIEYDGTPMSPAQEGMEQPVTHWMPAFTPSGMVFYTGERFAKWQGNLVVGGLSAQRLERLAFNAQGQPIGIYGRSGGDHEPLLAELKQRIRDVRQGPDGLLYVLTDYATNGALLRIEPAQPAKAGSE